MKVSAVLVFIIAKICKSWGKIKIFYNFIIYQKSGKEGKIQQRRRYSYSTDTLHRKEASQGVGWSL